MSIAFPLLMLPVGVGFLVLAQFTGSWLDLVAGIAIVVLPGLAFYLDSK